MTFRLCFKSSILCFRMGGISNGHWFLRIMMGRIPHSRFGFFYGARMEINKSCNREGGRKMVIHRHIAGSASAGRRILSRKPAMRWFVLSPLLVRQRNHETLSYILSGIIEKGGKPEQH